MDDLADGYLEALAAADPVFATFAGIPGHDHRLTDVSPAGHDGAGPARPRDTRRPRRARPARPDGRGHRRRPARAPRPRRRAPRARPRPRRPQQHRARPSQTFRDVFDITPDRTTDGLVGGRGAPRRRPRCPGRLPRQSAAPPRPAAGGPPRGRSGRRPSRRASSARPRVLRAFARGARTSDGEPGPPREVRDQLEAAAQAAAAAYLALADWLESEVLAGATDRDAVGRDLYAVHAREFLGVGGGPRRDLRLGPVGDAADRAADGGGRPRGWCPARRAATTRSPCRRRSRRGSPRWTPTRTAASPARRRSAPGCSSSPTPRSSELAGTHFDIPAPVRTLRCRIAPSRPGGIYYTARARTSRRPGQMWWSVPAGTDTFSHLARDVDRLPRGRSRPSPAVRAGRLPSATCSTGGGGSGCWVSGHGEGWALYAERLMEELGYLDDAGDLMGMLDAPRAARGPGRRRHRRALRAARARRGRRRAPGTPRRPGRSSPAHPGGRAHAALRAGPLPRLAGPGDRRTRSASGPGSTLREQRPRPGGRRVRPAGLPPPGARPRVGRARRAALGRAALTRGSMASEPRHGRVTAPALVLVLASASPARLRHAASRPGSTPSSGSPTSTRTPWSPATA